MKHLTLLAVLTLSAFAQSTPSTVFILPMPGGLDQFLAVHLTESGAYRVVTDPTQATLVLTDRINEAFEATLQEFAAPPTPTDLADSFARPRMKPLTSNRGTLFLVDRASHQVLWSTFEEPKTSQPKALNWAAERIVKRLVSARK